MIYRVFPRHHYIAYYEICNTDLLPSDSIDGSFTDFEDQHQPEAKMFAYNFLDGDGRADSIVEEHWVHNNIDISKALLEFRSRVVENNFGLSQPMKSWP
ncbi:hypothetical protein BX616_000644 [Lobosporangium transversale]|nr:hypothetical protein BX616_000644 [Lobosporangium transversale]